MKLLTFFLVIAIAAWTGTIWTDRLLHGLAVSALSAYLVGRLWDWIREVK